MWQAVLESDFSVPTDRPLNDLTSELVEMLGHTAPGVRDDLALTILSTWISRGVHDDLIGTLGDSICRGLGVGLGEDGTDTVYRRTSSALVLAGCIDRDASSHLVAKETFLRWSDAGLSWFLDERDLRGFDPRHGWAHAVAHGADLLATIAASPHTSADEARVVLDVVAERLRTPTRYVLRHGEDDRLALAVLTVIHRNLLPVDDLDRWVESIGEVLGQKSADQSGLTPAATNTSAFVRALYVHLASGVRPALDDRRRRDVFRQVPAHRADLLLGLLSLIPRGTPWLYAGPTS